MVLTDRVGVGVSVAAPALEVLPADQTHVTVDPRQRDGAQLLEVEVEEAPVDGVEVGTLPVGHQSLGFSSEESCARRLVVRILSIRDLSLQILLGLGLHIEI